jgi:hypothetical protein
MGLVYALVDRARILENRYTGEKVNGTKIYGEVEGPWFKVRITERFSSQTLRDGRTRVRRPPELLYALVDEDGGAVELRADMKVQVDSPDFPMETFQVDGKPEIMRRRRGLVGGLAMLKSVQEPGSGGEDPEP